MNDDKKGPNNFKYIRFLIIAGNFLENRLILCDSTLILKSVAILDRSFKYKFFYRNIIAFKKVTLYVGSYLLMLAVFKNTE